MASTERGQAPEGFGTTAIHAGNDTEAWGVGQLVPPISLSTTFKQDSPTVPKENCYARYGNPTRNVLQENLAALEEGKHCRVYSSGLSASIALINLVKTGDHIIAANNIYGGTQSYLLHVSMEKHGLDVSFVDTTNLENIRRELKKTTRLVWIETPSNPLLHVTDIAGVVDLVKAFNQDIVVVADNTFMTPYFQRPLTLGVDAVVHSITKYLNGHTDVLMGAVVTNSDELDKHLYHMQHMVGAVPSPFDCYLVHRGLKTLHLRMQAHMVNALAIAEWLESNPRIEKVFYPELKSHPHHATHKKQTSGMSGMVSFYLKGGSKETEAFLTALKVVTCAVSLGGYESLAEAPYVMAPPLSADGAQPPGITPNLIRLSVGCEDKKDLIEDLDQALKKAIHL